MDTILTRMGAYDNMFSNASTFKVELDEWHVSFLVKFLGLQHGDAHSFFFGYSCKILRDATPKSLVILDGELRPTGFHSRSWCELGLQNLEGVLRRMMGWRLRGYVIHLLCGFEN